MPIKIHDALPAIKILEDENIFVITEKRADIQDIRPLKIVILNLMPTKIETETQLLRLLGNSPLQIEIELLQAATHYSKNTSQRHLLDFYKTFDQIKDDFFDGLIITGAPVELLEFEEVDYWQELCTIMDWAKSHVFSTFYICWGAQAGLYHYYGIPKYKLPEKLSGIFRHKVLDVFHPLMRGFDDRFFAPHSRNTTIYAGDIEKNKDLIILSTSKAAGIYIVASRDSRHYFITGHSEYDRNTLANEYFRDINKGLNTKVPANYFPADDPAALPILTWRSHANLIYTNWLNYVYQQTPFNLSDIANIT